MKGNYHVPEFSDLPEMSPEELKKWLVEDEKRCEQMTEWENLGCYDGDDVDIIPPFQN